MKISRLQTLSIIIPVYNEEKFIIKTIEDVLASNTEGLHKEIIIINDGSSDATLKNTLTFLKTLGKSKKRSLTVKKHIHTLKLAKDTIIVFDKPVNEGKGAAVKTGFMQSTGDIVLVQDADLEYDPADYSRLLGPIISGDADVVFGSRFASDRPHRVMYFWHYVGNTLLTFISNMCTDLNLTDMETCYKVFRGDIIRAIAPTLESSSYGFEPEVTAKVARNKETRIYEVGIAYRGRTYKQGKKLIWWKDGFIALYRIIQFNFFR